MLTSNHISARRLKWSLIAISVVAIASIAILAGLYFGGMLSNPQQEPDAIQRKPQESAPAPHPPNPAVMETQPEEKSSQDFKKNVSLSHGLGSILFWLVDFCKNGFSMNSLMHFYTLIMNFIMARSHPDRDFKVMWAKIVSLLGKLRRPGPQLLPPNQPVTATGHDELLEPSSNHN